MKKGKLFSIILSVLFIFMTFPKFTSNASDGRLYNQWEERWTYLRYSKDYDSSFSLYDVGCGIFSFANALYQLNDSVVDIKEMADWAVFNVNALDSDGLWREPFYNNVESAFGSKYSFTIVGYDCGNSYDDRLKQHLQNGGVAVGNVYDHFIALTGYDYTNGYYHVIESAISDSRGLSADSWVSSEKLNSGNTEITWFALIGNTSHTNVNSEVPSKPILSVASEPSGTVKFNWTPCSNTTHYDLRIYNSNDEIVYAIGQNEDAFKFDKVMTYTDTSHSVDLDKGSYYARVAAVNNDSAKYTFSEYVTFNVLLPPKISDVNVKNVDSSGYTIECKVTDRGTGISKVQFPTWTFANDQDDIQSSWWDNPNAKGKINGNIVTYRVNISDHNNELGDYITHIYAYSDNGEFYECYVVPVVTIENKKPQISDVKIINQTSTSYTVQCKVTDNESGIDRVMFPTWTEKNEQDDIAKDWGENNSVKGTLKDGIATFTVNIADHNNEIGEYNTHIYAYDKCNNFEVYRIKIIIVSEPTTATTTTTKKITTTTTTTTKKPATTTTTSLSIEHEIYIKVGKKYTIKTERNDFKYKSSNEDVAIVSDKGIIAGISKGTAIITLIYPSKDTDSITVHVIEPKYGDANGDNDISIADAVIIMQSLANPDMYGLDGKAETHITDIGYINADCCNVGDGVTNADALAIQKYKLSLIKSLPEKK